ALRIGEKRIAAVDNHVAFFEKGSELIDDRVDRPARFHHDHCFARALERSHKFLHRARGLDIFPLGLAVRKLLRHLPRPIEDRDGESLRFHIEDEIFAHDSEADQSDITLIRAHFSISLITPGVAVAETLSGSYSAWQFPFAKFH